MEKEFTLDFPINVGKMGNVYAEDTSEHHVHLQLNFWCSWSANLLSDYHPSPTSSSYSQIKFKYVVFTVWTAHSHLVCIPINSGKLLMAWKICVMGKSDCVLDECRSLDHTLEKVSLRWKRQFDLILCLFNDSLTILLGMAAWLCSIDG